TRGPSSRCRKHDAGNDEHRLADAALQGASAFLEGELPDDRGTRADGAALPADLFARTRIACFRVRRPRSLYGVPDPGARDDVGIAEFLRQRIVVDHSIQG